ncbi:uncharacterized protein PFL1_01484 [Pseudozyma flocculosa PF-1]|uniref:uncharacterized protein n=1 Tax=Pseudozyma flocculosa PF-1 TaxID=1277687 RepID=UPI0004560844|nr:uncharacterized protein PFL1_01484 [Pseudozyma flocculosa PF-1]EPQ31299.1 hypothetical protein PFL1_01484 [Pseudozyma flocculosa PF-1]
MPYWLRGDARLPELASCSFTISPPDLVRLTSPSSDVHLHTSGHDTAMEPDPYSTWMCIARSEDFCVHLSQEHERLLAHDLIGASLATMLNLSSDARALASLGLAAARETPSDASITAAQLVEALQTINCPSIRIRAKGRDEIERTLAGSSVLERRDLVWFFRAEVITRGITLLRGPRNSFVHTFPCLGQLGAGFGMVLVPLPARADGIHSVRISTTLTDVLSCLEGAIGRFWCPIEDEMSYNGAIAMAMAWQARIARRSACDLYGAAVEVSAQADVEVQRGDGHT